MLLKELLGAVAATTDTGLQPSTTYTYTITAVDRAGNEFAQASLVQVTTATPPAPANASGTFAWDPNPEPDIAAYIIYTRSLGGVYTAALTVTNGTPGKIEGLPGGKTYFFVATAYSIAGLESDYSNEVSYTVP